MFENKIFDNNMVLFMSRNWLAVYYTEKASCSEKNVRVPTVRVAKPIY